MPKVAPIDQRKADHIKINLEQDVRSALRSGLEKYHFTHEALPEVDLNRLDTTVDLFGKRLQAPVLVSSMTGGTAEAETINLRLAEAAQECGIAMGVGSQRAAIEHPEQAKTFQVRRVAPGILFEWATDGPGFMGDEPYETVGEKLSLPPFLENKREYIESVVRPINTVRSTLKLEKEYL